jgi:hypothetical protein
MSALGGDAKKCQQAHQVEGARSESMVNQMVHFLSSMALLEPS